MHFYFVSFNNHKNRVLYNQEVKMKMQERGTSNQRKSANAKKTDNKIDKQQSRLGAAKQKLKE